MRNGGLAVLTLLLLLGGTAPGGAQDSIRKELRESQLRLDQIRKEREQLQSEMRRLQNQVHDVSNRLLNIERQVATSSSALQEMDFQASALAATVDSTTRRLLRTRDRQRERRAVLHHRLRSIYKRGPLHDVQVLLGAESFGELLSRYKYLHLIAQSDRTLIREIAEMERRLVVQERELSEDVGEIQRLRAEKLEELAQLRSLESEQQRALRSYRQRERQAQGRLQQLARDEARLSDLVTELERRRLEAERRRVVAGGRPAGAGTITTRDLGALEWPVEGRLVYRFGPERRPNGVVLRWNGIGIASDPGAPVRTVEAGTVVMAGAFEGYGPSVMISHGGGYYTLYLYLGSVSVRDGQEVGARQVIGTVGGERTPEGPHIEFQVRAPLRNSLPEPVDPLNWLRSRAGAR